MQHHKRSWTDPIWSAYDNAPTGADTLLHLGRRYLMPLLRYAVPLARTRGRTAADGEPGSMLVAGTGTQLLYLQRRFFASDIRTTNLGACPVHALPRTLLALGSEDDLTIAQVARSLVGLVFDRSFLRVPDYINVWIAARDRDEVMRRMSLNMRRKVRAILVDGYYWAEEHELDAFERFYDGYYVPFITARHDELAVIRARPFLRRHFRHGGILWVVKDGEKIAGALYRVDGPVLTLIVVGTRDGSLEVRRQGALGAINLFLAEAAIRRGLAWVNLGSCMPSPYDGSLMNKRRWGGELRERPDSYKDLVVRWPQYTPRVACFLADAPLIMRDRGGLAALTALPAGEPRETWRLWQQWEMPGLDRLYVVSADRWRTWRKGDAPPPAETIWLCDAGTIENALASARDAALLRPDAA